MRRPCNGREASLYGGDIHCRYINGPVGRPFSTEPAMIIHRNPVDAPYTRPLRPYGYTSERVPYEPLLGLGCWKEPSASPTEFSCQLRRNFF